jgi:hypothetical protein
MATVMPGPTPTAAAVQGVLSVDRNQLHFVSISGGDSTRTFVITAKEGPVTGYTIAVPPGLPGSLTVSPLSGSLADGDSATITVTAASTVPFVTSLTVYPGGAIIAVDVKANPHAGELRPRHRTRRLLTRWFPGDGEAVGLGVGGQVGEDFELRACWSGGLAPLLPAAGELLTLMKVIVPVVLVVIGVVLLVIAILRRRKPAAAPAATVTVGRGETQPESSRLDANP